MMNLTTFQINKITKETIGKTCSQLINDQIILDAKRNLLATSNQVNLIAFDIGFEDPQPFLSGSEQSDVIPDHPTKLPRNTYNTIMAKS